MNRLWKNLAASARYALCSLDRQFAGKLLVCSAAFCLQGTGDAASGQDEAAVQRRVAELVNALGSPEFSQREHASQELLAIGEPALGLLKSISAGASFEVRHRSSLLHRRIEEEKFDRLSKSFLLDLDDNNSYGLPGWQAYRERVGSSRTSKLLFLEMIREQPEVALLIEQASLPEASTAAQNRLASMSAERAVKIRQDLYSMVEPKIGDVVSMLVAACTLTQQTPVEISDVIVSNEHRSFGGNIHKQGYGTCLKRLMAGWLLKTHQSMAPTAMEIALRYDLAEGAELARKHLTPNFDGDTRKWAFYCLSRFGNEADVPQLASLLDDKTVVDEFARGVADDGIHESNSAPPGTQEPAAPGNLVVRINDLALVTILLLTGEEPTTIFTRFQSHPQLGFFIHSLASTADAADAQQQRIQIWKRKYFPQRNDG
jgi:hypothetical protein